MLTNYNMIIIIIFFCNIPALKFHLASEILELYNVNFYNVNHKKGIYTLSGIMAFIPSFNLGSLLGAHEQPRDRMFDDFFTVDLVWTEKTQDRQVERRHLRH